VDIIQYLRSKCKERKEAVTWDVFDSRVLSTIVTIENGTVSIRSVALSTTV